MNGAHDKVEGAESFEAFVPKVGEAICFWWFFRIKGEGEFSVGAAFRAGEKHLFTRFTLYRELMGTCWAFDFHFYHDFISSQYFRISY